jgi:putative transcriptional regulator
MYNDGRGSIDIDVLENKRDATKYRILVEIARRQPAVNQQEVADAIGVTIQSVSENFQELIADSYLRKHQRGHYEVTETGSEWLLMQTKDLQNFLELVSAEVLDRVGVETAIATEELAEGDSVDVAIDDGTLYASAGKDKKTSAVAITAADEGEPVGVTDLDGTVNREPGEVTIVPVPGVRDGGLDSIDIDRLASRGKRADRIAVDGTEALAAAKAAELQVNVKYGASLAVPEAAQGGIGVLLIAREDSLAKHLEELRKEEVPYELLSDEGI